MLLNDFRKDGDAWQVGSLTYGRPMEIVARVRARGGEPGQPLDLFDVRLGFEVRGEGRIEIQQLARVSSEDPAKVDALPVDVEVERVVELLMAARGRREMVRHIDSGNIEAAWGVGQVLSLRMQSSADRSGNPEFQQEGIEFDQLVNELKSGESTSHRKARKRASYQAYKRSWSSIRNT